MNSLEFSTIGDLSKAIEQKSLSPVELLDDVLSRIDKLDPILNMFVVRCDGEARAAAKAAEDRAMRGTRLSKLDGIPTSIKDLIAQKNLPQRFGSKATPDANVLVDAPSVERLRKAGAILLGKSTTSEFGCKPVGDSPLTGITRNPWNTELTPGGSSCGAAAMVAAGIVPYAIGTDGGGSVRIPASLTGLFGIKAQFGRVPVYPVSATPTLAHVGPLTRTVEDAAIVLQTISGFDSRDPYSIVEKVPDYSGSLSKRENLKIAWSPTLGFARPSQNVLEITSQAVEKLRMLGHEVVEIPHIMDDPEDLWNAEFYAGVGSKLHSVIKNSPMDLDPAVLDVLKIAISQEMGDYYSKVFERYAFRERMREFFDDFDLLISPTVPVTAFSVGKNTPDDFSDRSIISWVFYTYPFNLTGQPAASLPVGFDPNGLPVGLQVVGKINDESTILALCSSYEQSYGQTNFRPSSIS